MAIKAGRVGVDPSQVTLEGKIKGGGVSPEVLTKEEARRIYQTIAGMVDYLTKNNAELTYQKIRDMVNYQLKLVSGTNIKRINGEDILGSGNISVLTNEIASGIYQTISGMSAYALKSELPDTSDLLTKTEAPGYDDILTRASASLLFNNKLSVDGSSINVMPTGSDVDSMVGGVSYFPGGCLNTPTNSGCLVISGGDGYSAGIQLAYTYDMGLFYRLKLSQNDWGNWTDLLVSIRSAISNLQNDVTTMDGEIGNLSNLNTTNKNNLVNAINEVNTTNTNTITTSTATGKFIRGVYVVTNTSTITTRIQDFINQITTDNVETSFDVLIKGGGVYKLNGLIYPDKTYGAGIVTSVFGDCSYWQRYNGADTTTDLK